MKTDNNAAEEAAKLGPLVIHKSRAFGLYVTLAGKKIASERDGDLLKRIVDALRLSPLSEPPPIVTEGKDMRWDHATTIGG